MAPAPLFRGHSFFNPLLDLGFIFFVKFYIIIPNQVITLFTGSFRCFCLTPFLPGKHGFTNMYAAVINQVDLLYPETVCFQYS